MNFGAKDGLDVKLKSLLFSGSENNGDFGILVKNDKLADSFAQAKVVIDKADITDLERLIGPFVLPAIEASEQPVFFT